MSSEEPSEDGKLSPAKSWFSRSASNKTVQNASIEAALDEVSESKEGALECVAGFTSLRQQLSMRRPMGSGEIKKDSGEIKKDAGAGNSSMAVKNVTPLTPLTPLKWKSSFRAQEEGKAPERSRLGSTIPVGKLFEECPDAKPATEGWKEDRPAEGQPHGSLLAKYVRTNPAEELNTEAQAGNIGEDVSLESLEGPDRKTASGDDVMTMTIEFLRARLLSERSASRTGKLKIQQLVKKVSELEEKLNQALEDQKKAEASAQEALIKLTFAESSYQGTNRTIGEVPDRHTSIPAKGPPLSGRDAKHLRQDVISDKDLSRTNSNGSSVEDRYSSTKELFSESLNKLEDRTVEQGRPGVRPAPHGVTETSQELPHEQESRNVIESRLRSMWSKISEDMTALAEARREDVVRTEIISWMNLVPAILQNVMPKEPVSRILDVAAERIVHQGVPRQTVDNQPELSPETMQVNEQLHSEVNRATLLRKQLAAQENVQQEWERNYQEPQRQVANVKRDTPHGSGSSISSAGHPELQHADNRNGPNGVGRQHNPTYQNTPAYGRTALEHSHWKNSRIHQDPFAAPSRLAEDGFQSSMLDLGVGESSWDDRERQHCGYDQQARPRHGDAYGRMERDSYYRASEIEESYSPSQPEVTHRHRHQRSHTDNYDWPAAEDCGSLYHPPELSPGLGRRQSYSGYPSAMAADPRRMSFDKLPGSYDDMRCVNERTFRADEHRRNSFPTTKVHDVPGQLHSPQRRSRDPIAEPTLSLGYGPAYDAPPREDSPVQQSPKSGLNKNINDVLRALQLAKAKIQNGNAGSMGRRPSREQVSPSMRPDYGMEPPAQYIH